MIDEQLLEKAMALLGQRAAQCDQLVEIVRVKDEYLTKAVGLIKQRDKVIEQLETESARFANLLKSIVENPEVFKQQEVLEFIRQLPSVH